MQRAFGAVARDLQQALVDTNSPRSDQQQPPPPLTPASEGRVVSQMRDALLAEQERSAALERRRCTR